MGADTRIEWATHTFNPWRGCTKVAAGCTNCYAEAWSKRNPGTLGVWGDQGTRVVASEAQWRLPLKWARQAREREGSWHADTGIGPIRPRVFCASLADVFEDRPELVGPRARLLDLIFRTPELDWLLLTKRPENIERLWDEAATEWGEPGTLAMPMSNVWLGTSIACQEDADRNIPLLLQVPASVRFVSAEPLIGLVDLTGLFPGRCACEVCATTSVRCTASRAPLDWLIVGGESGPRARPCDREWIRGLRDQAKAAGIACFIKQLGSACYEANQRVRYRDPKSGDPSEWPEDLRVREVPS